MPGRQLVDHNWGQKMHMWKKTKNPSHWDLVNFSENQSKAQFWIKHLVVKLHLSLIDLSLCNFQEKIWENLTTNILGHLMESIWLQSNYPESTYSSPHNWLLKISHAPYSELEKDYRQ